MAFLQASNKPARLTGSANTSVEFLNRAGCNACPLNDSKARNPKMLPYGVGDPRLYILGETPTQAADKIGRPMAGPGKELLLTLISGKLRNALRMSNVVRTPSPKGINPVMIECCRPSVEADIGLAQPLAIVGLGEGPLKWALNQSGIRKWTGRHVPIRIKGQTYWFFPLTDPTEILKKRRFWEEGDRVQLRRDQVGSEEEFAWTLEVKKMLSLYDKLPEPIVHTKEEALADIVKVDGSGGWDDVERVRKALARYAKEEEIGFDYETNRLRPFNRGSKILTAALAGKDDCTAIALDHSKAMWTQPQLDEVFDLLCEFLLFAKCRKISHNLHFELEWSGVILGREFVRAGRWEDTVTQAWLIDERNKMGKPDCLALEFLTILYFGINIKALNTLPTDDLDNSPLDQVLEYNGIDAKYHRLLFIVQHDLLERLELLKQYENMLSRVPTAVLTQIKGVPIKQATVEKFYRLHSKNIAYIEEDIRNSRAAQAFERKFGKSFDPGNNNEVLKLIKHVLKADTLNKKEKESSDYEVLERIKDPIAALIVEHREASKALSTYVMPVREGSPLLFEDKRIHPQISTTRTQTSRTASEEPNSQNWPKHEGGAIIRAQVAPEDDERIVSFDYGQIQARNIAQECMDEAYIKTFWNEDDIHKIWAKRAVELFPDYRDAGSMKAYLKDPKLQKDCRQHIKNNFVFPTFFGAQPRGISVNTHIPENDVQLMQEELFDMFPGIKVWQDGLLQHYRDYGWITGRTGIKRRAPCSPNQLINAPIQADEAWIVCDAWSRLSKTGDWRLQANMEIHDDLTFIWKKKDIDELAPKVITIMLAIPFKWVHVTPMAVEMSVGKNWAKLEEVGKYNSMTWKEQSFKREDYA